MSTGYRRSKSGRLSSAARKRCLSGMIWRLTRRLKSMIKEKEIDKKTHEGVYCLLVSYRSGDMWAPKVQQIEALKLETEYFVNCILKEETPMNDGHAGLRVVKILEACNESLKKQGEMIHL